MLTILNDPHGFGIGARHITVSTVGVLPGIVALAARPRAVPARHLDPRTDRRAAAQLMPINTKYPLADVIAAAKQFDRRVTFEYVMLGGVNDGPEHARELAALAQAVSRVRQPDSAASGRRGTSRPRRRCIRQFAAGCGATASRWRFGRAAAWTSPPRAVSYG